MNELTEFYGRDEPSRTYKWAVVAGSDHSAWRAIAWFKTRKAAEAYVWRGIATSCYGIARAYRLNGAGLP